MIDLRIKEVNNGFIIFDDYAYEPHMIRLGETTHVAKNIDDLCEVIRETYRKRENAKRESDK